MIEAGLVVGVLVATAAVDTSVDAVLESARQYVPAKITERTMPKYPGMELRKGKEGWVRVAYCIDESGQTRNISVLDSVGGRRFDAAAVETVEQWKFEPARVGDEPSWQSRNHVYVSFALEGRSKAASPKFVRQFKKLNVLLKKQELEEADKVFWHVLNTYDLSLYELSKLWAQRVRYEGIKGDLYKLDLALHRATASGGQWIDQESYVRLLGLRVKVEVQIGQYKAAFGGFERLLDVAGADSREVSELRPVIDSVRDLIDGDSILKLDAKVMTRDECNGCDNSWSFSPVRRSFMLQNVAGNLTKIVMRCDHKHFESSVSDQVQWNIPERLGECHIDIYGTPGTTFEVLMLPESQS